MERLLRDAETLTGVKYDINNLADVYSAIHAIQEELGITGTTAKEAEQTINGSANMMKASWQNVLSAIAGGGDLDRAINNLVYSIQKYFENIVPVVERSLVGIGRLIEQVAPMLVQNVASALIQSIPSLINAIYQMIIGLAKGIWQGIKALFTGGSGSVTAEIKTSVGGIASSAGEASTGMEELGDATEKAGKQAKKSLAAFDDLNIISSEISGATGNVNIPSISGTELGAMGSVGLDTAIMQEQANAIPAILQPAMDALERFWEAIEPNKEELSNAFSWLKTETFDPLANYFLNDLAPKVIDANTEAVISLKTLWASVKQPLLNIWETTIQPIFSKIGEWFLQIVEQTKESFSYFTENINLYKDEIEMVIKGIGAMLKVVWAVVSPILSAVVENIGNVLKTTIDFIFSVIQALGNFFGFFENIFKGIKELMQGNTDEAIVYFKQAFGNFVNIFVGIANSIISVINNLWTLIFQSVKGVVNAIGGLINEIGSFIGKDWNLSWNAKVPLIPSIPKYIPKLATGAVLPPNKPFMAVVGDQKNGTNIEAPADLIKQKVMEAMIEMGGNFGGGNTEVVLEIDGREFGRAVVEQGNRENRRIGTRLVIA